MSAGFGTNDAGSPVQGCPGTGPDAASGEDLEEQTHWIEIALVDEDTGKPVPNEQYCIRLPDGVEVHGTLDAKGFARVSGIETAGNCRVTFPDLEKKAWKLSQPIDSL